MNPFYEEAQRAFEKAHVQIQECHPSPLVWEQKRWVDQADKAICAYLRKVDEAFKATQNSTLHFAKKISTSKKPLKRKVSRSR